MSWYSAHIVMVVELKDAVQEHYPAWENIILIEAANEEEAFRKAESRGRADEGDEGGSFRWGRKPARWAFAGVRKLTECATLTDRPGDGDEISFNELELPSREAVREFARGKRVDVSYNDRFALPASRRRAASVESKHPKRKGA